MFHINQKVEKITYLCFGNFESFKMLGKFTNFFKKSFENESEE